ncbi:uncharacterized protein LOC127831438 [Dreissena polymorpha]|uniref:uncharacterized protein LOC127831438 n=1 Tax=Dreissena polymorpha TaxID=45954 RepID=UPI002263EABB|nr:uncharacterized protein LOC127831438 [Dreissena polymorpha]
MSQASSDVKRDHIYLTSLVTRIPTRRHADLNKSSQSKTDPASSIKRKGATLDSQASTMNPEWKSMFGSTSSDRSLSSSPKSKTLLKPETKPAKPLTGSQSSSTGSTLPTLDALRGDKNAQQNPAWD